MRGGNDLAELSQPYRVSRTVWIFDNVGFERKPVLSEQPTVLGLIEATMIQRLAVPCADRFPVGRTAGKQQSRLRRGMDSKDRKHGALIVRAKVICRGTWLDF